MYILYEEMESIYKVLLGIRAMMAALRKSTYYKTVLSYEINLVFDILSNKNKVNCHFKEN